MTTEAFYIHERRILIITCFAHFMSHFNMLVFPALVLPLAERLGMSLAQVLGISFWMYLLFGLTALPWGIAADRWGALPLLKLYHLGSAVSCLAAALLVDSPLGLMLSLALLGFFSGIYHPSGLGLISKEIRRISMGLAYNGMFGNLGTAMAPLATGIAVWFWGPRAAFITVAALNMLGFCLLMVMPLSTAPPISGAEAEKDDAHLPAFVILLVVMMLAGIVYRGATVILPSYFELKNPALLGLLSSATGMNLSANLVATAVISCVYVMGMLGQYTGGRMAERFNTKVCYLGFHMVVAPTAFLIAAAANLPLIALAAVYIFFLLGTQPIENTLVARFTPRKFHHSAYGTKFILTFGVGSLAVKLVQAIETNQGIERVFSALGMVSLILVGVIVALIVKTKHEA